MNHRERYQAVLDGRPPDRVPFSPRLLLWYNARLATDTMPDEYKGLSLRELEHRLRVGTPAVLVPFETGRETEQRLRAQRLAALGVASVLSERDLSAQALARSVAEALARPRPAAPSVRLDGAERSVALVGRLASERRQDAG